MGGLGGMGITVSSEVTVCEANAQTESTLWELGREALASKQDEVQKQGHLPNKDLGSQWRGKSSYRNLGSRVYFLCSFLAGSLRSLPFFTGPFHQLTWCGTLKI